MVKVIKYGVTHKGNVLEVGTIIDGLKTEDENRLINEGRCEAVKKQKQAEKEAKQSEQSEAEQPKTDMPSSSKWL